MSDMEKSYTIRLSAVLDKSTAAVGQPMEDSVRRARKRVEGDAAAMASAVAAAGRRGAEAAALAAEVGAARVARAEAAKAAAAVKAANVMAIATANAERKRSEIEGKAFDERLRRQQREHAATETYLAKKIAEVKRETDAEERAEQRRNRRSGARRTGFASSVVSDSFSNMRGAASAAMHTAGAFAQGAGANFDLGSYVDKVVKLEQRSIDIANSGYIPGGAGAAGKLQDPGTITKELRGAATAAKLDSNDVGAGVHQYVKRTGDLDTARQILPELAVFAKATSTSFEATAGTAAEVANALGDIPDKGKAVMTVLRGLAGQGKVGGIEFSDLAKQFGKVSSAASKFVGSGATEGERRADSILKLGAIAQLSRLEGGSYNASTALTSVQGFAKTLTTSARLKEFHKQGISVMENGMIRNPLAVIEESLKQTKGDPEKLNKLFMGATGQRAVQGFATEYNRAGGATNHAAGMAAVNTKYGDIFNAALKPEDIKKQFDLVAGGKGAKAQDFNNQLESVVASLSDRVLPAMEKLAPRALELAEALAKVTGFAAENPGQAIVAAIVGSIAKAAVGNAVNLALSDMLKTAMTGGTGGGMNAMGKLGQFGMIISIAAATIVVGTAIIDAFFSAQDKGVTKSSNDDAVVQNAISQVNTVLRNPEGQDRDAAIAEAEKARDLEKRRIDGAENHVDVGDAIKDFFLKPGLGGVMDLVSGEKHLGGGQESADAGKLPELRADMARLETAINNLRSGGPLSVTVTNMPAGGPVVPQGGRRGVPG